MDNLSTLVVRRGSRVIQRVWAGLVGMAWLAPFTAALGIGAALLNENGTPRDTTGPIVLGSVAGLAAWIVAGVALSLWASASRANSGSFGELMSRIVGLESAATRAASRQPATDEERQACDEAKRAQTNLHLLRNCLNHGVGLQWINGNAYISAWERLHRIEEALLLAKSSDDLVEDLLHDKLRISGSQIPNMDRLQMILDEVRHHLSGVQDPCHTPCEDIRITRKGQARAALRQARFSINDYRDQRWNGLLQLHNQTMDALLLTNMAGYALMIMAIAAGATGPEIKAAIVYFLVGSAIGLFNQLYRASQAEAAVEDYGLSMARLLTIPTFSGLAAVGGVLVTAVASGSTVGQIDLHGVFNLSHPSNLLAAAVFGLTPSLLITRLGDKSAAYQKDIKSSEVTGGKDAGGTTG